MSKNSEMSFAARLASLTGSAVTKTAGLVDAHPETSRGCDRQDRLYVSPGDHGI